MHFIFHKTEGGKRENYSPDIIIFVTYITFTVNSNLQSHNKNVVKFWNYAHVVTLFVNCVSIGIKLR